MQRIFFLSIALILVLPIEGIGQDSRLYDSFKHSTDEYDYAYYLPDKYDTAKIYPVIIGPGEGKRGSDKCIFWDVDEPGEFGWILVEFSFYKQNSNVLKALLEVLKKKFHIEGDKFHIMGFSANSTSSFGHVIANPDYFHSVTGLPGHPASTNENQINSLTNIKVRNIVGEMDGNWLKKAQEFEMIYEEAGINSVLEVIPNGEHFPKDLVGKGFFEKMEKLRN